MNIKDKEHFKFKHQLNLSRIDDDKSIGRYMIDKLNLTKYFNEDLSR